MLYRRGKTWWTRTTVGGVLVRKSLKTTDRFVAQQAEGALVRMLGLRASGIETHGETKAVPPERLVGQYAAELERLGRAPRHVRQTREKILRMVKDAPSLAQVTPER